MPYILNKIYNVHVALQYAIYPFVVITLFIYLFTYLTLIHYIILYADILMS